MRRILITNDDGIMSGGIIRLAEAAKDFGEVWVVAPEAERSAASHSITLRTSIDVLPHDFPVSGVKAFSCRGTPADCVRVGCLSVMPEKPEVVLSGINYGHNVATDIQYSATAGAAFEADFQGCRGIAVSEMAAPSHETADAYLSGILKKWIDRQIPAGQILNINFPGCPLKECRGILEDRKVSKGMIYKDHYEKLEELPGGGIRWKVKGVFDGRAEDGTDLQAVLSGYVSVGLVRNIS